MVTFPRTAGEIDPTVVEEIARQLAVADPPRLHAEPVGADRRTSPCRNPRFGGLSRGDGCRRGAARRLAARSGGGCRRGSGSACRAFGDPMPRAFDRAAAADRVDRIVRAAIRAHDERFYAGIIGRLAPATRERLEALLRPAGNESERSASDQSPATAPALLLRLRGDPGKPSLAGVQDELAKLELVRRDRTARRSVRRRASP